MIWLTWRQHRAQLLVTTALLLVLGALLLVSALRAVDVGAGLSGADLDDALRDNFRSTYQMLSWLPIVPGLVGLFWGAPIVAREFERGTHKLAWTQSVTRTRWLAAKLAGLGILAGLAGLGLGAMIDGWLSAFDGTQYVQVLGDSALFGSSGVAAGAWWFFAFMLGAASGAVFRKLLPALAVTAGLYFVVMFLFFGFRRDYAEPVRVVAPPTMPAGLVTGTAYLAPDGTETADVPSCANEDRDSYLPCIADSGYESVFYLQPESRYWRFQWTEAGLLLGASVLLGGVVVYRVARRPL